MGVCNQLIEKLHEVNPNPFKDDPDLKRKHKMGRKSNAYKQAQERYDNWEGENGIRTYGTLDALLNKGK